ncbi:hypothetical protein PJIAN_32 [Paludibacter jiangxiensis]|uniref:Uncharacterized protein n=1 Tax=Paludibacter jiangxiensis TaxID=681398 RepID=A0A161LUK8_9BACT|nr:hypothetical protein PJIAN_32 [Paludibacter jiangxiensis]
MQISFGKSCIKKDFFKNVFFTNMRYNTEIQPDIVSKKECNIKK